MKLLLTSGGITNTSIEDALADMLGKPVADSTALCIPTALWGYPRREPVPAQDFLSGRAWGGMTSLKWKSLGVLELAMLPTVGAEHWVPWVQEADVLLAAGGETTYLCYWMRESGLADLLPSLADAVWVGVSAGSLVMTPRIGDAFVEWSAAKDDRALGVVDFSIFPHLDVFPREQSGRGAALGSHHRRPLLRARRPDGAQGCRWPGGGHLRRTLEALSRLGRAGRQAGPAIRPVMPRSGHPMSVRTGP